MFWSLLYEAIQNIKSALGHARRDESAPVRAPNAGWTPSLVEEYIDRAGRAEVFAEARRLGWTVASPPPMWVWGTIARDILARKQPPPPTVH